MMVESSESAAFDVDRVPGGRERFAGFLNRAETFYLRLLRATLLIIATLILIAVAWLTLSSLYKLSRSTSSVIEEPATVVASEIVGVDAPAESTEGQRTKDVSRDDPKKVAFYRQFVRRYHGLFKSKFEPYRHADDKRLSEAEFADLYVGVNAKLAAIREGRLDFARDSSDLNNLSATLAAAADSGPVRKALQRYKTAKKVAIVTQVPRTRVRMVSGWNRYSTNCVNWFEEPIGCSETRPIVEDYQERVTNMEYPRGVVSYGQIFNRLQSNYLNLLSSRREQAASEAQRKRSDIAMGHVDAESSLIRALQLGGAFLILMFFFLLIAIERSVRRVAAERTVQTA